MSECNHDCSSCSENCSEKDLKTPFNKDSSVKKVYAVISGKGGVGKSSVTSLLAVAEARKGKKVAILDADITGPSIPNAFGINERAESDGTAILPVKTKTGIEIMSMNCLLPDATDPVVWRGPIIAGAIQQFWKDVKWGNIDTMFIDCPPGTGDVPLTIFQSLKVDGIIVVTTPQTLVSMIVEKAVNMAKMMNVKIVGLVENMSYFKCPDCGKEHKIFGESDIEEFAARFGIEKIVRLPIETKMREAIDNGTVEFTDSEAVAKLAGLTD